MAHGSVIAYNAAAFVSALFLLESGADRFVDHTAVVARRTGIPDTVIALLTAGAEWEELVVVVASLAQGRPSLAVGNVVGSAISNILGAFSLGLLCRSRGDHVRFDTSARLYSLLLLAITTLVAPVAYLSRTVVWRVCGALLIVLFAAYVTSIGWAISRGKLTAPEGSDSDTSGSDSDGSDLDSGGGDPDGYAPLLGSHPRPNTREPHASRDADSDIRPRGSGVERTAQPPRTPSRSRRSLGHHLAQLVFGFLAICLAGYVLSRAAINVTDAIGISDVLFAIVILAIATTLPEKFVAVLSGSRGHAGILVANTVGSNIFLLSLCLGIIMLETAGELDHGGVNIAELAVLWGATLAFTLTVWFGSRFDRWIGGVMLLSYVAFIVLEFTVIHTVVDTP